MWTCRQVLRAWGPRERENAKPRRPRHPFLSIRKLVPSGQSPKHERGKGLSSQRKERKCRTDLPTSSVKKWTGSKVKTAFSLLVQPTCWPFSNSQVTLIRGVKENIDLFVTKDRHREDRKSSWVAFIKTRVQQEHSCFKKNLLYYYHKFYLGSKQAVGTVFSRTVCHGLQVCPLNCRQKY